MCTVLYALCLCLTLVVAPRVTRDDNPAILKVANDCDVEIVGGIGERLEFIHRRPQPRHLRHHGALRAARWLVKRKPGLYGMPDVFGL